MYECLQIRKQSAKTSPEGVYTGITAEKSSDCGKDVILYCTVCQEDGINVGQFCCKTCRKYFCNSCERQHKRLLKEHPVLNRSDVDKWGSNECSDDAPLDMCEVHEGMKLVAVCMDHDSLGCSTCVFESHRQCKNVQPLNEAAKMLREAFTPDEIEKELLETVGALSAAKSLKLERSERLNRFRDEMLSKVSAVRQKFDKMLDYTEARTVQNMNKELSEIEDCVKHESERCSREHANLERWQKNVKHLYDSESDVKKVIAAIKIKNALSDAKLALSELRQDHEMDCVFEEEKSVEKQISKLRVFGSFDITNHYQHIDEAFIGESKEVRVTNKQKVNIRQPGDKFECFVAGLCSLPGNFIALSDYFNQNVKILNEYLQVVNSYELSSNPFGMTYTCNNEFAVCIKGNIVVLLKHTNGQLTSFRELHFNHNCVDIKYSTNRLYISSSTALFIYTKSGQLVKKLYEDSASAKTIYNFAFKNDRSEIYLTSPDTNSVVTVDMNGRAITTSVDKKLEAPAGLCVSNDGSVFVCGQQSNVVLQLDIVKKFRLTTVVMSSGGLKSPNVLLICEQNNQLVIGHKGDKLLVLTCSW